MRDRVLNNESFHALRVRQDHAKAHRATVILHVERVARETERLGEMVHYLSVIVEGVCEFLRDPASHCVRNRGNQALSVIAIAEPCEERLKHPRRRRKSVQQEKRWSILRSSLPVEDRQAVDLHGAIECWSSSWIPFPAPASG